MSGTSFAPVPDPPAAEAQCAGRLLEREGIPMVLALVDEAPAVAAPPGRVPVTDATARDEGLRFAALLAHYRDALRPDADDALAVQDVVTVLAWAHRPGATPPAERR